MVNKKKYHGGFVILLGLLFMLLFSIFSNCYANMSSEYLDYCLETAKTNFKYPDSSSILNTFKSYLNSWTPQQKELVLNNINNYMNNNNLSNLTDRNIFLMSYIGSNYTIKFFICNNGAPNGVENIDFFAIKYDKMYKYSSSSTDYIYQINIDVRYPQNATYYKFPTDTTSSSIDFTYSTSSITENGTVIILDNLASCGLVQGFQYVPLTGTSNPTSVILVDRNGGYIAPEPEIPSGESGEVGLGNITNNNGDSTGNINLQPIQNSLNNIENKIPTSGDIQGILSGETGKITNQISGDTSKIIGTLTDNADNTIDNTIITSGDIEDSLGFEIAKDPYSNFWVTLTNNLKTSLLGTKRDIDITFQGRTWNISLDNYLNLPPWLIIILTPFSTAFFTWVLVRQWKHIFDKLASGNVDSLLKENSEERYI